jgi:hypothetical protein
MSEQPSVTPSDSLKLKVSEAKSVVGMKEHELRNARERLKEAEENLSNAYPMICECCERGTEEPHTHWSHKRRGKDFYYIAKMIPRP